MSLEPSPVSSENPSPEKDSNPKKKVSKELL